MIRRKNVRYLSDVFKKEKDYFPEILRDIVKCSGGDRSKESELTFLLSWVEDFLKWLYKKIEVRETELDKIPHLNEDEKYFSSYTPKFVSPYKLVSFCVDFGLVEYEENHFKITQKGKEYIEFLKSI